MTKSKKFIDTIVLGFALFSMLFGAGNLIFPAYTGVHSAAHWATSFGCFFMADAGIALVCIFALIKNNNQSELITNKIGKIPDVILNTAMVLCLGPMLAIPRTAATTYEIFAKPTLHMNSWVFSAIYFGAVVLLTLKPGKVVDVVGAVLTPVLLVGLGVLIVAGIINPADAVRPAAISLSSAVKDGISTGYQTMDAMGILVLSGVLLVSLSQKGYNTDKQKRSMIQGAAIIASAGLLFVYGGLAYLGATSTPIFTQNMSQTDFLMAIAENLLGPSSGVLLGVIVSAACLTTAIGLTSAAAQYFCKLSNNKISYSALVWGISIVGLLFSNIGLSAIISIAAPVLSLVYPVLLTLVCLSFFNNKIKNEYIFRGAALGALATSICTVFSTYVFELSFMQHMPLNSVGFEWVIPACVGGLIGACIKKQQKQIVNQQGASDSITTITFALPFSNLLKK